MQRLAEIFGEVTSGSISAKVTSSLAGVELELNFSIQFGFYPDEPEESDDISGYYSNANFVFFRTGGCHGSQL